MKQKRLKSKTEQTGIDVSKASKRFDKYKKVQDDFKNPLRPIDGGTDVLFGLDIGGWKGSKTSEMAVDHEGIRILRWVLNKNFSKEVKEIIEDQINFDI